MSKVDEVGEAVLPTASMNIPQSPRGFDLPKQPLVLVPGHKIEVDGQIIAGAKEICEARGMRLPTPLEWAYMASGPNKFDFSTRDGKLGKPGVHYSADSTRKVGEGAGHYVEWGGEELWDMSGDVYEWTYDPVTDKYYVNGGSWHLISFSWDLRADSRYGVHPDYRGNDVGFRCVVSCRPRTPVSNVGR